MLDGLFIKAANSWLGYKSSKAIIHAMKSFYKMLNTRINGHEKT